MFDPHDLYNRPTPDPAALSTLRCDLCGARILDDEGHLRSTDEARYVHRRCRANKEARQRFPTIEQTRTDPWWLALWKSRLP